ncbi:MULTISPECIES: hypothetical protein [Streptomyces]|uniref:hypothetical protein n=1 Tax=Streptomyces TaxID=1883 RepID=UPI000566AD68|nr:MULTISPECIES: hypothetical protein [Streptomyces]KMS87239.1 hypothetical protein ACZ91_32050 [Streptomyces regensis]
MGVTASLAVDGGALGAVPQVSTRLGHEASVAMLRSADVTDESGLITVRDAWGVRPGLFVHPWESEDPK